MDGWAPGTRRLLATIATMMVYGARLTWLVVVRATCLGGWPHQRGLTGIGKGSKGGSGNGSLANEITSQATNEATPVQELGLGL